MLSLVNDLLDLSKIEAGGFGTEFCGGGRQSRGVGSVSLMRPRPMAKKSSPGWRLRRNCLLVHADERSLRQIVLNLLANAVRYNEPGGQVIVSTALSNSGHAALRIKDTGVGISESESHTALEPFRQVAAGARRKAGLGLP